MDGSDLVEDDLNDDTLSYFYERLDCSSFEFDSDYDNDVASDEIHNKVFDEVVIENKHAPCNEFYDEYSNVMTNPFSDFKGPFEDCGLVSDSNIDDICEYKSYIHLNTIQLYIRIHHFKVCVILFPKMSMKLSYSELIACMFHLMKKNFSLSLIFVSMLIKTFIMRKWLKVDVVFI